ncbi:MAG: DUF456 domain-containing protein [Nocardioidaceae bacterium]|nr:DUF456 domain-containing protein [Nocardioidaceae bacterium]
MSSGGEVLVGLVILVGLVGIVVPVLPGAALVWAAIGVWAWQTADTAAWWVFGGATVLTVGAFVVKWAWPGRRLTRAGVPGRAIVVGGVVGLVGFFVIPVVGLFIGFPLGVWLHERLRLRANRPAWDATVHALRATGLSLVLELLGSLAAAALWLVGVLALT